MTRLDQFIEAWNELRNAVLGRKPQPPEGVPPLLAQRVANYYERFRVWVEQHGLKASVTPVDALPTDMGFWLNTYRLLVEEAAAAGIVVKQPLSMATFERAGTTAVDVVVAARSGAQFIFIALLVLGPVVLLANQGRRSRWR